MRNWRSWLAPVVGGLVLGYILLQVWPVQIMSYDKIPKVGETFDEYAFAWAGASMWNHGVPVAWTTNLGVYKSVASENSSMKGSELDGLQLTHAGTRINLKNPDSGSLPIISVQTVDYGLGDRYVALVEPYFDHPPLTGLIYGATISQDNESLIGIEAEEYRYANRFIYLACGILVAVLAYQISGAWAGVFAGGVYLTMPSVMLSQRLTLAENILALWLVAILLAMFGAKNSKHWGWLLSAGIVSGLAILTKMSGVAVLIGAVWLLYRWSFPWRQWLWVVVPAVFLGGMFVIYGTWLSSDLFWEVMVSQAGRGNWGIINVYQSMGRLFFLGFPMDGWWVGGLVVLMYGGWRSKSMRRIVEVGLIYLSLMLMLGGGNYAWYFFPLGAMWAIGYGYLMKEILFNPKVVGILLFIIFGLMSSFYWGEMQLNPGTDYSWIIRGLFVILTGGWVVYEWVVKRWPSLPWRYGWIAVWCLIYYRTMVWSLRGMTFILANWEQLPMPLMWGIGG